MLIREGNVLSGRASYLDAASRLTHCAFRQNDEDDEEILLGPVHGELDAARLVEWMLRDRIDARLNLQLHKYVWGPQARGV